MSTTDESVHVRPLRAEDAAWVQPLYAANSRDALTPEQRAEHGFVQGRMSAQALRARLDGPGSVVAEVDGEVVAHPHRLRAAAGLTQGPLRALTYDWAHD